MEPHRLRAYIILLFVYALWGISTPVIKFTLGGIDPLLFLFYRFLISTIAAVPIFIFTGFHFPKENRTRLNLILYGFLASPIALGLLFFGMQTTTALDSTLITLAAPLLISAAGVVYLKEHVTKREKVGMAIAFVGTIFTVLEPLAQAGGDGTKLSGNLLVFLYLLVTIIPSIQAKVLLRDNVSPSLMTSLSFIVGLAVVAPFAFIFHGTSGLITTIVNLPLPYYLGILYMALISGTLCYTLANEAQKTIEVGEASVFSYLYPIFTTPLAVFWLGEKITYQLIIGAIVITIGVIIAEVKNNLKTQNSKLKTTD